MRRPHIPYILAALMLCGLLSGCSISTSQPVANGPTARPTAYMLPTASATSEAPESLPTVPAEPTLAPTTAPPPTLEPAAEVTEAPIVLPTATPPVTAETTPPTPEPPAPAPTEIPPPATSEPVPATPTTIAPSDHSIMVDEPLPGALLTSPFVVRGSTNFWPFEATLSGVLKDGAGNVLANFPVMVQSPDIGQPGPFSEQVSFPAPQSEQQGTLEIFEASPQDGSIVTFISILVRLGSPAVPGTTLQIEQPEEGASVTTPLHIAFSGAVGDEPLVLRLTQADGSILAQDMRASQGYVVATMEGAIIPGAATLDIVRDDGSVLGRRTLMVVPPAETQVVKVAWLKPGSEEIVLVERRVPRTPQIASAALGEMLWGPSPGEAYATSLPAPAEVLASGARTADWGPRIRLLKLTITNGVALANFGPELRAYGGGSARVGLIRSQIEATLRQFPSVDEVVIAIDGQTEGILQP
jgi:hypothetical protein